MQPENRALRTFTLNEANSLLPHIGPLVSNAFHINKKVKSLTGDIENLLSIWGKDVTERGHLDFDYYSHMASQRNATINELMDIANQIQSLGCVIKDLDNGLVDFYHENNGRLVFLCWKYGEDKIKYWHPVDGGFQSRSSVAQLG